MTQPKHLIVLILLGFLTGCASQQIEWQRSAMRREGHPPEYVDGFGDGFSSGTRSAGNPHFRQLKNVRRYSVDDFYKQGWDDGFMHGKTTYTNTGHLMR